MRIRRETLAARAAARFFAAAFDLFDALKAFNRAWRFGPAVPRRFARIARFRAAPLTFLLAALIRRFFAARFFFAVILPWIAALVPLAFTPAFFAAATNCRRFLSAGLSPLFLLNLMRLRAMLLPFGMPGFGSARTSALTPGLLRATTVFDLDIRAAKLKIPVEQYVLGVQRPSYEVWRSSLSSEVDYLVSL